MSAKSTILGESVPVKKLREMISKVAPTKANILITGESGTGKELIAREIHFSGPLKEQAFVTINCGAIPENLMESEMFGHKRGSFTGAIADKEGLFQTAHKGTIFLDEVGELPLAIQVKLLRVLQDRSFRPVGGNENRTVDVRVISATNRDLEAMVARGQFREDLYYRLNVINIHSPPLRDRKGDIPLLVKYFLKKFSAIQGKKDIRITERAMEFLSQYNFPGNIRELQNLLERAVALESGTQVDLGSFPEAAGHSEQGAAKVEKNANDFFSNGPINLDKIVVDLERQYIEGALSRCNGIKKEAAKLLGITLRSLRYRMIKCGMGEEG